MITETYLKWEQVKEIVNQILSDAGQKPLEPVEEDIIKGTYDGMNYDAIKKHCDNYYEISTYKGKGKRLWYRFNQALDKLKMSYFKINKSNFLEFIHIYDQISKVKNPTTERDESNETVMYSFRGNSKNKINSIIQNHKDALKCISQLENGVQDLVSDVTVATRIEKTGRIQVIAKGCKEDIDRFCSRIKSGELKELNGYRIEGYKSADEEFVVQPSRRRNYTGWIVSRVFGTIGNLLWWIARQVWRILPYIAIVAVCLLVLAAAVWLAVFVIKSPSWKPVGDFLMSVGNFLAQMDRKLLAALVFTAIGFPICKYSMDWERQESQNDEEQERQRRRN